MSKNYIIIAVLVLIGIWVLNKPYFIQTLSKNEYGNDTLKVSQPKLNQEVPRTFEIKGRANVENNQVIIRLTNQKTKVLVLQDRAFVTNGEFTYTISLSEDNPTIQTGDEVILEVNELVIPLRIRQ